MLYIVSTCVLYTLHSVLDTLSVLSEVLGLPPQEPIGVRLGGTLDEVQDERARALAVRVFKR